jgi:hypothetical protein
MCPVLECFQANEQEPMGLPLPLLPYLAKPRDDEPLERGSNERLCSIHRQENGFDKRASGFSRWWS